MDTPPSPEQMAIEIKDKVLKGASYIEVATALRSYGEACVKEYRSIKPAEEDWSDIYDLGEQKGRRSALAEAAKVAGLHYENCKKDNLSFCPREIENEIRALAALDGKAGVK